MSVIKTKFDIGERVQTSLPNSNVKGEITQIIYSGYNKEVKYKVSGHPGFTYYEYELEPLKEYLTSSEKRYLESVVRPFKNRVLEIYKTSTSTTSYISGTIAKISHSYRINIALAAPYEVISLPSFDCDSMYAGMNPGEKLTLDELGLFKESEKSKKEFDF